MRAYGEDIIMTVTLPWLFIIINIPLHHHKEVLNNLRLFNKEKQYRISISSERLIFAYSILPSTLQ
jgi:hypothetical protein